MKTPSHYKAMPISRRAFLAAASVSLVAAAAPERPRVVRVFKTPTCGCCGKWVDHLRASGFQAVVSELPDLTPVTTRLGVPDALRSCHTGEIAGYFLEGHVPAADIRRLLAQRPQARGLAVPGMPIGSPGMEMGNRREPFQTLLVDRSGRSSVFARH